jgi:DNA-binding MarR family transcriptional regulator
VPHRTTRLGSTVDPRGVPWLVSRVMWSNFLRFIDDQGTTRHDLQRQLQMPAADMRKWLTRAEKWWGYLIVESKAPGGRIFLTPGGRKAIQVWRTLDDVVEKRWRDRFGQDSVDAVCQSLAAIVRQMDVQLPDSLPILGYGLYSKGPEKPQAQQPGVAARTSLPSLLSKVLLWYALEFEQASDVSLAISANVLRLVGEEGILVRDLPRQAAVSKEAIATALSFLEKRGYAVAESKAGDRAKVLQLTAKGRDAHKIHGSLVWAIEERWRARFGAEALGLRDSLENLVGATAGQRSPLFLGLEPYPNGWRTAAPDGLPHYPMVLHRGGFPDGS